MRKLFVLLLACLLVTGTASAVLAVVAINETNFPDAVFRRYISENFDANKDGILANNEILGVKQIEMVNQDNFRSLQGIKYLTSLEDLNIRYSSGFPIRELDISGLSALKNVYFYAGDYKDDHGRLTTVDASGCTALETLDFSRQSITSLNLSGCTALQVLDCQSNKLTSLDLTECTSLQTLYCYDNKLTSLNLEGCSSLRWLQCENNKLTSLNLQGCSSLCDLYCYDNAITALDLSTNTELTCIYCYNNKLESLNVKNCFNLQFLHAENNQLSALDLSDNLELSTLQCKNNHLPLLDVDDNTNMYDYSCSPQHIDGLKSTRQTNGTYTVNLRDYLADSVKNVVADSVYGTDDSKNLLESSYDSGTGIITFSAAPALVYYEYDTKYSKNDALRYMGVTLAASAAPYITTSSLPEGYIDTPYTCQLEANGETPITWTAEESLPDGLTLNSENGEISGTPATSGSYTLTITAANDFGSQTKDFTLAISDGNPSQRKYDFSILAGTWYASNETATATSGDLTAKMTLSAQHSNTITFKNINVSGNSASLESVSDIYMDIAGYDSEWEEDFGGYKPSESGVLEFKNVGGEVWRLDRTRHNNKPTYTIITIISENKLRIERYDDYGIIFEVKYTLRRDVPQVQYETTRWEIFDGMLNVEYDNNLIGFSSNNDGRSFKISGDLPANLIIHLPAEWELDVDDGAKVTVSDTSKVKEAKDVDGLESPAVKIIGSNDITLNESGIVMTAWYVGTITSETTSWTKQDSKLIVTTNGTPSRYEFDALTSPDTNGDGFKITGFPAGLTINLPGKWGIDIDTSYNLTVSDTSKIIPHTEIPGLPSTAHRIMGRNAITLNASDLEMTAYIFTAPTITTDSNLGSYSAGSNISIQLQAEGTKWTMKFTAENLPEGLSINDEGLIAGSISAAGEYEFTVKAENCAGDDTRKFTIKAVTSAAVPAITTESLADGSAGEVYKFTFTATGTEPITWTAEGLPEGFTLSSAGELVGISETSAKYTFTVTAENDAGKDSREFTLTIKSGNPASLSITTTELTDATAGQEYRFQLEAQGANSLTWSAATKLPKDLTLSKEGLISGTPITAGTYRVIVVVKSSSGISANAVLTLKVKSSSSNTKPKIKTAKLPDGFKDMDYSYQLEAEGTVDEWKLADGSTLPSGLDLDTETGEISGTITENNAKTFKFKVIAVNEAGESAAKNISIKITAQTPYFKTEDLKAATWNKSYSFTVKLANFKAVTWTIEGDMPEGLKFDKGKFSGKPQEVGEFDLTIRANNGSAEMEQDFVLRVNSIPPKFKGSFKTGTEGKYYECKLKATGSTPIEWDFSYLPEGLTPTIDATGETCIISGTPTEVFAQTIEIILTNGDNEGDSITTHKKMTIKAVKPRFATTAKDVPNGTVNESYSYQLQLKEGFIPANVTWDYNGNMPEGLELDQNGIIYGVPSKAVKNSRFTVFARNAAKESYFAKLAITMTINESEENTNLPAVKEDDAEDSKPEFVDGVAYYERGEISAEDIARLAGSNEIIAAYLPAVEVETENVYEFTVSLDVSAPEGGLLVWHSFPDGKYDDSESEAYFLDGEDSVIEYVPENHTVTVQAWLKPGIIYEPVIAVKISHKD